MNFDELIDCGGSGALKWENLSRKGVIPLWVADMDFPCPPEIAGALQKRAAHPVYGYATLIPSYFETLSAWYGKRYGVSLGSGDFLSGPGTVPSLALAVRAFSEAGDGVLVLTPVYHPFFDMISRNRREIVEAPLVLQEGRYRFDEALLEEAYRRGREHLGRIPLILFCSPHNPGGAAWEKPELETLLCFAERHGQIVVSDEIHGDFVFPPRNFVSMAAIEEYRDRVVVVSGANKSFNLGGLHVSHFAVRDKALKKALRTELDASALGMPDIFSLIAAETAYRHCGPWLDELKVYLRQNITETVSFLNAQESLGIRAFPPEGGYLVWADVSALLKHLDLEDDVTLARRLENEAGVKLTHGSAFGSQGRGFARINTACPRPLLREALERIKKWASAVLRAE